MNQDYKSFLTKKKKKKYKGFMSKRRASSFQSVWFESSSQQSDYNNYLYLIYSSSWVGPRARPGLQFDLLELDPGPQGPYRTQSIYIPIHGSYHHLLGQPP